jgi:hypothetical protein
VPGPGAMYALPLRSVSPSRGFKKCKALLATAALTLVLPLHAQNTRETELLYKVEINFRGGNDAGAMTDRRFTMSVTDSRKGIFMMGSRNPVASGSVQTQTAGSAVNTQLTYLDAGVSIECFVHAVGDKATMHGSLDLSNIGPNDTPVQCGNSQSYYQANQARSGDHCGTWQAYGIGVD